MAVIDMGDPHRNHFFKLFLNRAGVHDGPEVVRHGFHDFRTVRHRAEHIGDVSALL